MKKSFTLYERLVKRFYGIDGVLDEYKQQAVNQIGNAAFMMLLGYLLAANIIAVICVAVYPAAEVLVMMLYANMFAMMLIFNYVVLKIDRLELGAADTPADNAKLKRRAIRNRAIRSGLFFSIVMWVGSLAIGVFIDQRSLLAVSRSWSEALADLSLGILMGIIVYFYSRALEKLNHAQ